MSTAAATMPFALESREIGARAKPVMGPVHNPDLDQEPRFPQLSLWPNLNRREKTRAFTVEVKQQKRPDILSMFIRHEIQRREGREPRGWMQSLEEQSGLTRGHVTRIKNDQTDTFTLKAQTVNALWPLLGYDDYGDFLLAAGTWWKEDGRKLFEQFEAPERIDDPELRVAVEMSKAWAPRSVILETMKQFEPSKGHEDRWWWVQRITEKAKQHTHALGAERAEKRTHKTQRDKLTRARKEAPESSRDLAGAMPKKKSSIPESPAPPDTKKKTSGE